MEPFPKPDTRTALLESAGLTHSTITRHNYVETRLTEISGPGGQAYEFIFECQETSMQRRWGTERVLGDVDSPVTEAAP